MGYHKFELSDWDIKLGVTLGDVQAVLPQVLVRDGRVFLPTNVSPAVGGAVARSALGGKAEYVGMNEFGMPVYRKAKEEC